MRCQHNLFLYILKLKSLYQINIIFSNPFSLIPHPSLLSKSILHDHDYHGQALKNSPTKCGGLLLFLSIFFFLISFVQSSLFLVSVFRYLCFKCGIFIGCGQTVICVLIWGLWYVLSGYFQKLGFEDISK